MTLTLAVEMLQRLSFISVSDPRQKDDGSRRIAARFVGSDGRDVHFGQGTLTPSKSAQSPRKILVMLGLRVAGRCLSEWSGGRLVAGSFDSQASFVKYWAVGMWCAWIECPRRR
jgi:hypothetical protein